MNVAISSRSEAKLEKVEQEILKSCEVDVRKFAVDYENDAPIFTSNYSKEVRNGLRYIVNNVGAMSNLKTLEDDPVKL